MSPQLLEIANRLKKLSYTDMRLFAEHVLLELPAPPDRATFIDGLLSAARKLEEASAEGEEIWEPAPAPAKKPWQGRGR